MLTIAAVVTLPTPAYGQARAESVLHAGSRVRYAIPRAPRRFTGIVERVDTSGFLVRPDNYDGSIHLGFDSLAALSVLVGVRSSQQGAARGAVAGLTAGALIGTLATAAVWLSDADERCQDCWVSATGLAVGLSVVGTLGLGLIGGILGAASPGDVWHDILLRRHHP